MANEDLTGFDVHAINKILTSFELQREWKELSQVNSLEAVGYPFNRLTQQTLQQPSPVLKRQSSRISSVLSFLGSPSPSPKPGSTSENESQLRLKNYQRNRSHVYQLPLFRIMIQRVWGAFPGLIDLPIETWLGIERFILDFNSRNFSTSSERRQFTKRAVISIGFTKLLSSYIPSIIKFRNLHCLPTKPSPIDLDLISQLPSLISTFGTRIKFIQRGKEDEFLVIYRKRSGTPKLPIDSSASKDLASSVRISVIRWSVLAELLKTIDPSTEFNDTQTGISVLSKLFNNHSSQTEKLYQILEDATHPDPSSSDDQITKELNLFLKDELDFQSAWIHTGERVAEAKNGYKKFLHKIVHQDGEIDKMYEIIAKYDKLETVLGLDPMYEQAQTWTIMWIAYMLHFIFIAGPDGDEICELYLRIDKLIPYELIKQGLKIINPTLAVRTTVALIFGQPFGSLSLFQRILDNVVRNEIQAFNNQIKTVIQSQPPIDQSTTTSAPTRQKLLEAIKKFVYLSDDQKREIRAVFDKSDEDIVTEILIWSKDFDQVEIDHVRESEKIFHDSTRSPDDCNLFNDLILLLRLVSLKRDREQILEMITESNNPMIKTIKQILEQYYPTIYKVALATDLSKKFTQTEAFLKDLVVLLAKRKQEDVTIHKLVKLLDTHKQSYWSFLYDLVRCKNLCDPMKAWIESCFDLVKTGLKKVTPNRRFELDLEKIYESEETSNMEAILGEARSLSGYNRLIKMIDNIEYRLVFSNSSFPLETSFSNQAFQILTQVDQQHFGTHIDQSVAQNRAPLPFGWAWWIDGDKLCGKGADKVKDITSPEVNGSIAVNIVCVPYL
ncbi:hypothetical protein Pst134EB_019809 [Puccinia striiformis f. sp. tritici]|nr:hypothetical protein Pst134EB_019809 [Puccinia striiformis f. sp. tritici]